MWQRLHAGATLLPIVHIYGPEETGFILRTARARALVIPDRWRNIDYLERLSALGATPDLEHVIVVGERATRGARLFSDFEQLATTTLPAASQSADDVALLLFTSGTTGEPKGVQQSHNTIVCEWSIPFFQRHGTFLNPTPAGHIQGFNFLMRPMFWNVPMVMMERWDADTAAALVQQLRIEQSGGPPFFLMSILEAAERGRHDISSLKLFGLGGATVTPEHVQLAARHGITSGRSYGSTEHSTISTYRPEDPLEIRATTDGRLLPGTRVRIVDDGEREVSCGKEGEILLQGPEQFVGYLDPKHDAESFTPDGWFRSGDIGRLDAQGYLSITDRKKDLIIRGGENISSMEVEGILLRHAAVLDAAVDRHAGCEVRREGVCVRHSAARSFDHARGRRSTFRTAGCAKQKTPEKLVIVSELPRTPSGKGKGREREGAQGAVARRAQDPLSSYADAFSATGENTPMNPIVQPLFQPLRVRGVTLKNRVVMSPMTRSFSPGGVPDEKVAAYYRRRAEGETGLIITEGVGIDHPSALGEAGLGEADIPELSTAATIAGWKRVVDEVHAAGGLIFPQLWHMGVMKEPGSGLHPDALAMRPSGLWGPAGRLCSSESGLHRTCVAADACRCRRATLRTSSRLMRAAPHTPAL